MGADRIGELLPPLLSAVRDAGHPVIWACDPMHGNTFTSESVSEGHPDKIADQISDAVLDAILADDPRARVACETMVKTGVAIIATI